MLTFEKGPQKRKSKRDYGDMERFSSGPGKNVNESILLDRWLEMSPASVQECSVHHSYVKKIRDWLDRACKAHRNHGHEPTFLPWVLALCGPSGCGKSTIVELLCKEMKIRAIEWTDDSWDPDLMIHRRISRDSYSYLSHGSSYPGFDNTGNSLYKMDDEEEFERFTRQSAYPTLDLFTSSKIAKTTTVPEGELKIDTKMVVKKKAAQHPMMEKKKQSKVIFDSDDDDDNLLMDGDSDDFENDTRKRKSSERSKTRIKPSLSSIESSSSNANTQPNKNNGAVVEGDSAEQSRLILMHDLPHVLARYSNRSSVSGGSYGFANFASMDEGVDNQRQKAESLTSLLPMFRDPVVLIVSDVTGRDDVHYASRSFLPHSIRDKVYSEIIYQDKITPITMTKTLQKIINTTKQQCVRNGLLYRVLSSLPTNVVAAVAEQCHGDIRHALTQLQFYMNAKYGQALSKDSLESGGGTSGSESDWKPGNENDDGTGSKNDIFDLSEVIDLTGDDSSLTALTDTATESSQTSTQPSAHRMHKWDNLNQMDFDTAPVRGKGTSQRRDEHFSSLYSVAKLTNATLNADGQFITTEVFDCDEIVANSEMPTEMLMDFVHRNFLSSLNNSSMIETYGNVTSSIDPTYSTNKACMSFSDIDVFLTMKYDPNAALDRSQKIFPEQYVAALTARIPAISRGVGSYERLRAGRSRGAKHAFVPMHSPQSIGIRARKRELLLALHELSESMLVDMYHNVDGADGSLCKRRWSSKDLATSIVPYLNLQYDHLCAEWDKRSQPGAQKENDKNHSNAMSLVGIGSSQSSSSGGGVMNYLGSSKYNLMGKSQGNTTAPLRGFSLANTLSSFQVYALDMGLSPNVLTKLQAVRKAMHIDDRNSSYDTLISSMTPLALQSKVDEGAQRGKESNIDRAEEVEDIEDFDD